MSELMAPMVDARPDGSALVDGRVERTWRELDVRVNRWVGLLRDVGLAEGDRLAMVVGNRAETYEALLACLHAGIVAVPVNWHLTAGEVAAVLADCDARGVLADGDTVATVAAAVADLGRPGPARLVVGADDRHGASAVEPLLARASGAEPAGQCCGTVLMYTSGSTGRPRAVRNGLFVAGAPLRRVGGLLAYSGSVLGVPAHGSMLQVGPWYHSAQVFFSLFALLRGCRLVVLDRFDPAAVLAAIDDRQITATHLVPTHFVRLLELSDHERAAFDGSSLRIVWHGGGPCDRRTKRQMIEWWGPVLLEYYGATEGGVATLIDSQEWLARPGSVGRAAPRSEIVVVDEHGDPVPPGVVGRVFIRRANGRGFSYHGADDDTRRAHLAPGVFTYGEMGHLDEDGYLYLTGRAKELIVSGSVNIYPGEIERVLLTHPAVTGAAVIGITDHEFGERPAAVVETRPGTLDPAQAARELESHCRGRLAGFKIPRRYRVVASLPRDAAGKVRKAVLREDWARWERDGGGGC